MIKQGELDNGQADTPDEILSAKSAAMVIRHDVLDEIGGFDEDYFIYLEETDLGWRVWLKGFRIIFVPESRVYHAFGTTQKILPKQQNYLVKFHGTKNYITTLIKNLGTKNLLKILPLHIALWIGMAGWFGIKRQTNDSWFIIKGIFWNVVNLKMVWKKRRIVQKMRVVSDEDIMHKIMKKKSLNYFYSKLATPHKIGNTEGFYRPKEEIK